MMTDDRDDGMRVPELQLTNGRFPIDLRFPSDLRYIEQIVEVVARNCEELAFPPRVVNLQVPVALSEALSNAILYGNDSDRSKNVRLRADADDRALVLEVADEGSGFDLDACTNDPTSDENIDREDGRGLFLMQSFMDRVERYTDGGNVVRLTLLRP